MSESEQKVAASVSSPAQTLFTGVLGACLEPRAPLSRVLNGGSLQPPLFLARASYVPAGETQSLLSVPGDTTVQESCLWILALPLGWVSVMACAAQTAETPSWICTL